MFCHQMEAIQLRLCQQGPNLMKHLMMILTPATTPPLLSPAHVTPGGILYRSIKEDGAYFIGYSYITCRNQFWVESCSTPTPFWATHWRAVMKEYSQIRNYIPIDGLWSTAGGSGIWRYVTQSWGWRNMGEGYAVKLKWTNSKICVTM